MIILSRSIISWKRSVLFLFLSGLVCSFANSQEKADLTNIRSASDTTLVSLSHSLNEDVETGYGTKMRYAITGSIVTIKSENFNKGYILDPVQLIQGKVAGLSISKPGGDPNGSYEMRLRGLTTSDGNSKPLIVIDGMSDGDLNNVDPGDIESITVLKDGSASAIYGIRGSCGVLLVTTKRGRMGKPVISYNGYTSAEMSARNTPVMNAAEWRKLSAETGLGTDFKSNTDWFKEIERTAISQVHNISISGGFGKTLYRASVNYHNINGVMINTGNNLLNGRINLTQKALNDKLTLDFNMAATEKKSKIGFNEAFKYAGIYNPTAPVTSSDPAYARYDGYFHQNLFDYYNPVAIIKKTGNEAKNKLLNLSLRGTFEILKGLSIDAIYSIQNTNYFEGQYFGKQDGWIGMVANGQVSRQEDKLKSTLFESTVRYNFDLNPALNFNIMGGYSSQDFNRNNYYAQSADFLIDDFTYDDLDLARRKITLRQAQNRNTMAAYFGRIDMSISKLFFITTSARYEGSSLLSSENQWALFPAVGAGMDFSKILKNRNVDNLKLRMSYGLTGNQPDLQALFSSLSQKIDLKAEKNNEFDAGMDFSFNSSRFSGSLDFYLQTTSDMLLKTFILGTGVSSDIWLNIGKMKSSGLEFELNYNITKNSDFEYGIYFNSSFILNNTLVSRSQIVNGVEMKFGTVDMGIMGGPGQWQVPLARVEEGKPVGQLLAIVFKGIDSNGNMTFVDQNHDGIIDYLDRVIVGNGLPKFIAGFGNTMSYKKWDLNVFFRGVFGYDLINSFRAIYEVPFMIGSYNLPVTATNMRSAAGKLMINTSGNFSSYDIEKGSFISLDNMSLGYSFTLPENSSFKRLRLHLAGNNLIYITGYKGSDPNPRYSDSYETGGVSSSPLVTGVDRTNTWCRTRSVTFGVSVVF